MLVLGRLERVLAFLKFLKLLLRGFFQRGKVRPYSSDFVLDFSVIVGDGSAELVESVDLVGSNSVSVGLSKLLMGHKPVRRLSWKSQLANSLRII